MQAFSLTSLTIITTGTADGFLLYENPGALQMCPGKIWGYLLIVVRTWQHCHRYSKRYTFLYYHSKYCI